MRLAYSPRTRRDYNVEAGCIADFNLGEFLDDADVRQAFSHDAIRTFMLTVFDGASSGIVKTSYSYVRISTLLRTMRGW